MVRTEFSNHSITMIETVLLECILLSLNMKSTCKQNMLPPPFSHVHTEVVINPIPFVHYFDEHVLISIIILHF